MYEMEAKYLNVIVERKGEQIENNGSTERLHIR